MFQKRYIIFFLFVLSAVLVYADTLVSSTAIVAARNIEGTVFYYTTLHEAFDAAEGISVDSPDEITLLSDIVLHEPVILDAAKHIRLITDGGTRTIIRGSDNLDYPLFWVNGDLSSLTLGSPMAGELIIDGGFLNTPAIIANAPLFAVSGRDAKLIMYDGVFIQNNYNRGPGSGGGVYQNGAGVFLRTVSDDYQRIAEFIMKGGVIRGNTCDIQGPLAQGGGVKITGYALFTMEGGIIMNNSSSFSGGGFNTGSRGSFRKTGGIIYGNNAPPGLRNFVITESGTPSVYGHAVFVEDFDASFKYRDDTVGENDNLSYISAIRANGVFGEGEKWSLNTGTVNNSFLIIVIITSAILALSILLFLLFIKKPSLKNQAKPEEKSPTLIETEALLTNREKEVLQLLLSGKTVKDISKDTGFSVSSINSHSEKIYRKLNVRSRTELLLKCK